MTVIAIGTALPPWGTEAARAVGGDEDAVTLAVDAGRAAIEASDGAPVARVVLVTRDLPLLDGGNGAALVAGLGLPAGTEVVEQVGGAPAALDQVVGAAPGTLVIGADTGAASGAAAALIGAGTGLVVERAARVQHSLPVRARGRDGVVHDYGDPRLVRERGVRVALAEAAIDRKAVAVAGLVGKDAAALCEGTPPALATTGNRATSNRPAGATSSCTKSCAERPMRRSGKSRPSSCRIGRLNQGSIRGAGGHTLSTSPPRMMRSDSVRRASSWPNICSCAWACSGRRTTGARRARRPWRQVAATHTRRATPPPPA